MDEAVAATEDVALAGAGKDAEAPVGRKSLEPYVAPTEALLFLEVRPAVFAAVWWAMIAIHTFTAVLLSAQARLYVYLTDPRMSFYVNLVEPDIGSKYTAVAAVFGILSAFHWRTVILLVWTSIRQRKYAFFPEDHYALQPFVKPPPSERPARWWQRVAARLSAVRLAIWGRRGVLGVESKFFYPYFYLREFIELTSQIWQAYRGSLLVSRPWINHLSVSIIVVNCWLTPAFQIGYKQRPEVRRIAILTLDAVLDFLTAIVVPLSIFFPYLLDFHHSTHSFSIAKMYDETWFVNAVLENQEFLVVSVADMIFKCIPHISITGCLKKVRLLLRKDTSVRTGRARPVYATVVTPTVRRELARAEMARVKQRIDRAKAESPRNKAIVRVVGAQRMQTLSRYVHKYTNKIVRLGFVVVGCFVLGVHLRGVWTSYKANKVGCKQEMRPWFAPMFACSIFEVNCQRLNVTGHESEIRPILRALYAPAVAALVFTHCPTLEMPSEIQAFKHLMRIDVYNSSISRWDERAALTQSDHPSLATMTFAHVQFPDGALPEGLITTSFPDGLRNVEITQTNLAKLPEDLHDRWHHAMNRVFIEHSNLTHVPLTLYYIETEKLSLEGNDIASLEPAWLTDHAHRYLTLALSCNPQLATLPPAIHRDTNIQSLRLHGTNISALPDWISGNDHRVFASQTPLCQAITDSPTTTAGASLMSAKVLSCVPQDADDDISRSVCGLYPLDLVDRKRSQLASLKVAS